MTFEFVHGLERDAPTLRATATNADLITRVRAELQKPLEARTLHIHGTISAGSGDENAPWDWHFNRAGWRLAEMSMELCDGQPSYVNKKLEQWLREIGSCCPWASRVSRELQ